MKERIPLYLVIFILIMSLYLCGMILIGKSSELNIAIDKINELQKQQSEIKYTDGHGNILIIEETWGAFSSETFEAQFTVFDDGDVFLLFKRYGFGPGQHLPVESRDQAVEFLEGLY